MFKKVALAAFAAVSTCAFAQTNWSESMDPNNMSWWEAREMVMTRAGEGLSGGDAYVLSNVVDRAPSHVTMALVNSLARNYWQSRVIGYEIAMARYPVSSTSYTTTVTNPDGTVTTSTTTTTTNYSTMYADSMRPMRIVMETQGSRDISYDTALDILTSNLTTSEATVIRSWWNDTATERERDVIVRFFKSNTRFADQIFYPSTFPRQSIGQSRG